MQRFLVGLSLLLVAAPVFHLVADDAALTGSSWQVPAGAEVRAEVEAWLESVSASASQRDQASALLNALPDRPAGEQSLAVVVEVLAIVDPKAKELVEFCRTAPPASGPQSFPVLLDDARSAFFLRHLRLHYGAYLARHRLYDEAADQLASLDPADVVDPAGLLFHKAVVAHRLMQKEECGKLIARLLENELALPKRHLTVAKLMSHDLQSFKPDSLDEVARLMDDVQRRLDLGRAGKKVRDQEADIIARLDKQIKQLEEQRKKQQQQQSSASTPAPRSFTQPAEKSEVPRDLRATDETDPRRFNKAGQWGNLPPRQRQQALQQIGRDLPSHFRDTIEEYFKRLAQDGVE